eukprot:8847208-Alexandrium_andersonii.AAC.1
MASSPCPCFGVLGPQHAQVCAVGPRSSRSCDLAGQGSDVELELDGGVAAASHVELEPDGSVG